MGDGVVGDQVVLASGQGPLTAAQGRRLSRRRARETLTAAGSTSLWLVWCDSRCGGDSPPVLPQGGMTRCDSGAMR